MVIANFLQKHYLYISFARGGYQGIVISYTVNVVFFCWGKVSQKCWQDISRGGNFHDTTHISFMWVLFSRKEDKSMKNANISPMRKFPRLLYVCVCVCVCVGGGVIHVCTHGDSQFPTETLPLYQLRQGWLSRYCHQLYCKRGLFLLGESFAKMLAGHFRWG